MGIKKLNKILEEKNLIKEYCNISEYRYLNWNKKTFVLGIDFLLYLHKYHYSCDNLLMGFWNQIISLLTKGILPVYIIDGVSIPEKQELLNKKKENDIKIDEEINRLSKLNGNFSQVEKLKKKKNYIDKKKISKVIELFNIFNIPYLRANTESEFLAIRLLKDNTIDSFLTEDTDMLPLGCKSFIKLKKGTVYEYNLYYILQNLNITHDALIELCIILGCDYLRHNIKIDIYELLLLFQKYENLDGIFENNVSDLLNIDNPNINAIIDNYYVIKNIFTNAYLKEYTHSISSYNSILDKEKIINFASFNNILNNENSIRKTISYINFQIVNNIFN